MKKLIIHIVGFLFEFIWLIYVKSVLENLSIIQYMVYSIIIPALIVIATSFLYAAKSKIPIRNKYVISVIYSIVAATILTIFSLTCINEEIINTIVNNSIVSDNVQVSISQAKAGDNIQSYLIFIAIGGIGTMLGNKFYNKKDESKRDEYD